MPRPTARRAGTGASVRSLLMCHTGPGPGRPRGGIRSGIPVGWLEPGRRDESVPKRNPPSLPSRAAPSNYSRESAIRFSPVNFPGGDVARVQLLYPMLALVLLTFGVGVRLFRARVRSVREGHMPATYFKVYQGAVEPDFTAKPSRHFTNLFEAPTLFYAGCLAAMAS